MNDLSNVRRTGLYPKETRRDDVDYIELILYCPIVELSLTRNQSLGFHKGLQIVSQAERV
jgi:hypothetical protein